MRAVLCFAVLVLGCGDPDTLTPLEAGAGADDLAVRDLSLVFEEPDLTRPILCQRDIDCPGTELCLDGFCVERPDLATGCVDDTECKGGRVCRGGQCVDPPAIEDLGELVQDLGVPRDLAELRDLVVVYDLPAWCEQRSCIRCSESGHQFVDDAGTHHEGQWECQKVGPNLCGWQVANGGACMGANMNIPWATCDIGLPSCVCDAGFACVP